MRASCLLAVLTAIVAVSGQNVYELTIFDAYTTIQNFHLESGQTLQLVFLVDPFSINFVFSTLFRIPTGLFTRDTLQSFQAPSASISALSTTDFVNAVSLENLYLPHNPITELPDNVFANAPKLKYISLANCDIVTISSNAFAGLADLEDLNLYGNEIATLSSTVFAPLVNLLELDLGVNKLTRMTFANFQYSKLETLWIEDNEISEIYADEIIAPYLKQLYMYDNNVQKLENNVFNRVPSLSYVSLYNNDINEVEPNAFNGLPLLLSLDLYGNEIPEIPSGAFVPLRALRYLDLGFNEISDISFRHFSNQVNLNTLWLEFNNFEELDIATLVAMKMLYSLYVYGNELQQLDLTDVGHVLPGLMMMGVGRNEFSCQETAKILTNLRKFDIYSSYTYEPNYDKVMLDGIGCHDADEVRSVRTREQKKLLVAADTVKQSKVRPVKNHISKFDLSAGEAK